jgi:hypothetical protein
MMQVRNEIIVFFQFDSGIDASIAKAKLDAYGVPCFLTEENMASLYQQALGIKVRLHIFEKDREEATRVLFEAQALEPGETTCPKCHATSFERDFPKKMSEEFTGALKVMFFGVFMPEKKIFRCQQCEHEF